MKLFANLLKYTEMFTNPLTRVPRYILFSILAIKQSYLHDLSHMFLNRLKLLSGEIACQKRFFLYR